MKNIRKLLGLPTFMDNYYSECVKCKHNDIFVTDGGLGRKIICLKHHKTYDDCKDYEELKLQCTSKGLIIE